MGELIKFLAGIGLLLTLSSPAWADPRLDERVYSPYIENHVLELESRTAAEVGHGDLQGARTQIFELEAGLNDRLSVSLVGALEREPGGPTRATGIGLEGIYYAGQIPGVGVDVGIYLEYTKGLNGEADGGEAKLLLAKTADRFQGLLNLIVERPFSGPQGEVFATYGYAVSATWRTAGALRLGVQAFGDFGDDHGFLVRPQGAYIGPQLLWEAKLAPRLDLSVDAGWLASVGPDRTEAPSQVRLTLELEHRF